jgi:hypothetical protein
MLSETSCDGRSGVEPIDVVSRFGFVGDGRTDNTGAFYRWANSVNRAGGGHYVFPAGRYFVSQYRRGGTSNPEPPIIRDCANLTIAGAGAIVELNGGFHRSGRLDVTGRPLGLETGTFMPFVFRRCRGVRITGFEIDGGVRSMTRDPSVIEVYSYLIALHGCRDVELSDLNLHHSQTDAILLYEDGKTAMRPGVACRDIKLSRVRCTHNARGGLAPIQVYGLNCTDCSFNGNWFGLGSYTGHAPGFGVDVEPDYWRPDEIDTKTGNIEFRRCEFADNASAVLAAYSHTYRGYLRLIDCRSSNRNGKPYHMILNWPGAVIEGGLHDAGEGTIYASWEGQGGNLTIRDCQINTSGPYGLFHAHSGNSVQVERVRLMGTHRGPSTAGWVLSLQGDPGAGRRNLLRNCEVFVPRARKSSDFPYDYEVSLHHTASQGNLFQTDLPAAGGAHFCVEYGPNTTARADHYLGTALGRADSFRPGHMSDFDTRELYSHP